MTVIDPPSLPLSDAEQRAGRMAAAWVALGMLVMTSFRPQLYIDGDTGWHIAAGRWILENLAVPRTDSFSFSAPGTRWVAHEWLPEAIMAGSLAIGSWPLLSLLFGALLGLTVLIIGHEMARWLDAPKVIIALLTIGVMLLPAILARPHLFAWPVLALWTVMLLREREANRPPPLRYVLVMLLWANLHGSFIFGLLLAGLFALEALISGPDRRAVIIGWGRFGLLALLAGVLPPLGFDGLLHPITITSMNTLGFISEWQPTQFPRHATFGLALLFVFSVLLARGVKVPPVRVLLLGVLLYLAFIHIRHQPILALVGGLALAEPLGRSFMRRDTAAPAPWLGKALAALLLLSLVARLALPSDRPPSGNHPAAAIAWVPETLRRQPVLNEYSFGGSLIFAGIKPFVDGRADMYGDRFMQPFSRIADGDKVEFDRAVQRWKITWTILMPKSPIVARLDADPRWRRAYEDRWAVIHVRRDIKASAKP